MATIVFEGPGTLQLEEGGKVYAPGDPMPARFSDQQRVSLQATGLRFTYQHDEPVVTPDDVPAEMAAAEQIGGPAVVAAVEDVSKDDVKSDEPAPRASRKGN